MPETKGGVIDDDPGNGTSKHAAKWYRKLSPRQRARVLAWLARNPPVKDFKGTRVDWAHLEITFMEYL